MNPASYRSCEQLCFYCACMNQLRRLFLLRSCPQTSTATLTPPSLTPALASHSTSTLSSWFHGELFELRTLIWTVVWKVLYIKVTSCNWWRENRTSSPEYDIIPALSARCVSAGTTTSSATATVCATWSCTCSARSKKSCHGFLVPSHDSLFSVTVWTGCRAIRPPGANSSTTNTSWQKNTNNNDDKIPFYMMKSHLFCSEWSWCTTHAQCLLCT